MIQSRPALVQLFQNDAQHGIFENCIQMFILSYPIIIIIIIFLVIIVLLHVHTGDPLADHLPPIRAVPPGNIPHE